MYYLIKITDTIMYKNMRFIIERANNTIFQYTRRRQITNNKYVSDIL